MSWETLLPAVDWLGRSALGEWLGQSTARIGWLLTFHLLGITLLLGSMLATCLHLIGVFLARVPTSQVRKAVLPIMLTGFALALTSGTLTFIGGAQGYFEGGWFRTKMQLLIVALLFQATLFRWMLRREPGDGHRWLRLLTGLMGLGLWFGVAFSGRAIAFF